jgi:hypothetical protein
LLLELAKPNRKALLFGAVFGFMAIALGLYVYSELALSSKVREGERAVARVARLSEGFCLFGSKKSSCIEMELEVFPAGRAPFKTEVTRSLQNTWLSRVQPGSFVTVSLDRSQSSVVYLDEEALELPPPAPPQ